MGKCPVVARAGAQLEYCEKNDKISFLDRTLTARFYVSLLSRAIYLLIHEIKTKEFPLFYKQ